MIADGSHFMLSSLFYCDDENRSFGSPMAIKNVLVGEKPDDAD